jgi:hypothetical protein
MHMCMLHYARCTNYKHFKPKPNILIIGWPPKTFSTLKTYPTLVDAHRSAQIRAITRLRFSVQSW